MIRSYTMIRYHLYIILLCIMAAPVVAQREFGTCDSTVYPFSADSALVATRYHLFLQTTSGTTLVKDFSQTDESVYIRDVDIAHSDLWYVLVGSRYIGFTSTLFRSTNKGKDWLQDTSFYPASNNPIACQGYYKAVNQMHVLSKDTLVLFLGYYESGIVYSTDGGSVWKEWFYNPYWVHYQGFLPCGENIYLYSFAGDGFAAWMFAIPRSRLFQSDSLSEWNSLRNNSHPRCSGENNPRCVYVRGSYSRCEQYRFFVAYRDSLCGNTTTQMQETPRTKQCLSFYPNPAHTVLHLNLPESESTILELISPLGITLLRQEVQPGFFTLPVDAIAPGVYTLRWGSYHACFIR